MYLKNDYQNRINIKQIYILGAVYTYSLFVLKGGTNET